MSNMKNINTEMHENKKMSSKIDNMLIQNEYFFTRILNTRMLYSQ